MKKYQENIDFNIPNEIFEDFKSFNNGYYKGWWEIVSDESNECDQKQKKSHWHNNEMTIILHPKYYNSNTIYYFFKLENDEIKLDILGTRYNGMDIWYKEIPYGKKYINKVIKYIKYNLKYKGGKINEN